MERAIQLLRDVPVIEAPHIVGHIPAAFPFMEALKQEMSPVYESEVQPCVLRLSFAYQVAHDRRLHHGDGPVAQPLLQNEDFLDELLRRPGKAQKIALAFQVSRHVDLVIHHETPVHVVVQTGVPDGFLFVPFRLQ